MTKTEKLEKAMKDHKYALKRIGELEKELSNMRFTLRSVRQELRYATGQQARPEPNDNRW